MISISNFLTNTIKTSRPIDNSVQLLILYLRNKIEYLGLTYGSSCGRRTTRCGSCFHILRLLHHAINQIYSISSCCFFSPLHTKIQLCFLRAHRMLFFRGHIVINYGDLVRYYQLSIRNLCTNVPTSYV